MQSTSTELTDLPSVRAVVLLTTILLGIFALTGVPTADANTQELPLSDYTVSTWTTKDGLPSDTIWTLAQDQQGFLWLGTNAGLVRFDGEQFLAISSLGGTSLPQATVRSLFIARDGSLWIGFSTGDISYFHNGQLCTYAAGDLRQGAVTAFAEGHDGTMWAGSATGLLLFDGNGWKGVETEARLHGTRVTSVFLDRNGDLLVGSNFGIFRRGTDQTFRRVDTNSAAAPFLGFAEDPAGRLWISDPVVGFRQLGEHRSTLGLQERARGNDVVYDENGYLWVATMGQGIWRVAIDRSVPPEKVDVFGPRAMIEDHGGNIWAGTGESLIRIAKPRVKRISDIGLVNAVAAAPDGDVWASTEDGLTRFPSGEWSRGTPVQSHTAGISALHATSSGAAWISSEKNLTRFANGNTTNWPLARYGLSQVTSIASDARGTLWVADRDRGLFRWMFEGTNARVECVVPDPGIVFAYGDRSGRVWFDNADGRVGVVESTGNVRFYSSKDGLGRGPFHATFEDHTGIIWLGGIGGLYALRDGKFLRVGELKQTRWVVNAITEDNDGDLWVGTAAGIAFLRRSELETALASGGGNVGETLFDTTDGLAGMPIWFNSLGVVRAANGDLWWVTGRGASIVNPRLLKIPQIPARVFINGAQKDGRPLQLSATNLPSGANRLQIEYSALQLSSDHPIRFRYQLEGFDSNWIDAGTHRDAMFTHLSPQRYRFRVSASNSDGSWSDTEAIWNFSILPEFYQTRLFLASCVVAMGGLIWAAWSLHLRRIRRQFSVVLAERVRLSRELHDTLLQSLVGISLQFESVATSFLPSSPAHKQLVQIRKRVEEYIRDARSSIWSLRSPMLANQDLPAALRESAARAMEGHTVQCKFVVHGTPYQGPPIVEQQLLRIGQEAILNALRHSHASQLDIELSYELKAIKLRVADNGHGFDPARSPNDLNGHFGLTTMQERAELTGGRFVLRTKADFGTVVEVVFPSMSTS